MTSLIDRCTDNGNPTAAMQWPFAQSSTPLIPTLDYLPPALERAARINRRRARLESLAIALVCGPTLIICAAAIASVISAALLPDIHSTRASAVATVALFGTFFMVNLAALKAVLPSKLKTPRAGE